MRINMRMTWMWVTLLVLCITSNMAAQKIITSPDWPDPFVAGELIVAFTEEAIEPIAHALEQGVEERRFEERQLTIVPYRGRPKFAISNWDTRPWVTGIGAIDSLNRSYGLKSIHSVFRDDPYGRRDRGFVLVFPEDMDVLRLMDLYAKLKEVEYVYPNAIAEMTVIQASSWGRIKARYLERRVVR